MMPYAHTIVHPCRSVPCARECTGGRLTMAARMGSERIMRGSFCDASTSAVITSGELTRPAMHMRRISKRVVGVGVRY